MKKFEAAAIIALLVLGFAGTVAAGPSQSINGKGKAEHLFLFEKDPVTWQIVEGGAFGVMTYKVRDGTPSKEKFTFNGTQLAAMTAYSLVYYPDPWPGNGLMVLGTGTSTEDGYIDINGNFDFDSIPAGSSKIWLVLSADTDGTKMTGWNPAEYLFEYQFI